MARPVVLSEDATLNPKTGYYHLHGRYSDLELVGPATVMIQEDVTLNDNAFTAPFQATFRSMTEGEMAPIGAIIAEHLTIERCTLRNITFLAHEKLIQRVGQDLLS